MSNVSCGAIGFVLLVFPKEKSESCDEERIFLLVFPKEKSESYE